MGSGLSAVDLHPSGKRVATGGADGVVIEWLVADGARLADHRGHENEIQWVEYSPRGELLVSAGPARRTPQ